MSQYRLFFSWQNDCKKTKPIINSALKNAVQKLAVDGIELFIDQDTRNRVGKRNIDAEVLEKIRNSDIFLADLTPVITYPPPKGSHDLPKHMPNSNVMYEYGYALHAKGEKRMIVLASLDKEGNEHIEYMPFDINHDTITLFTDEKSLKDLHLWIRKITEDVDKERAEYVPKYDCTLLFRQGEDYINEITIHPRFKRICYTAKKPKQKELIAKSQFSMPEIVVSSLKMQQALFENLNAVPASIGSVKIIKKTTKLSYEPIQLVIFNAGSEALDNLHIRVIANDKKVTFAETNIVRYPDFPQIKRETDTFASDEEILQSVDTVNPQSSFCFDEVFVHMPHDIASFKLLWQLSSRTFRNSGELTVCVEPEYKYVSIENDLLANSEDIVDLEESE